MNLEQEAVKLKQAVSRLQQEVLFKGQTLKDPLATQAPHQFKVGDSVLIKGLSSWGRDFIGKTGKVSTINDAESIAVSLDVDTYHDNLCIPCYLPSNLELVKVDYEAKYNELVKTLKEKEDYISELHSDVEEMKKDRDYHKGLVDSRDTEIDFWQTKCRSLESELATLRGDFKIGDEIVITGEHGFLSNEKGIITEIYSDNVTVQLDYPHILVSISKKGLKKV